MNTDNRRTKIPLGIGITLIVCGSLAVTFALPQIVTAALGVSIMDIFSFNNTVANKQFTASKMIQEKQQLTAMLSQTVYLAMSIWALIAGVWLKSYRPHGLKHALLWAKAALLYIIFTQTVFFSLTLPETKAIYAELGLPSHSGILIATDIVGLLFSAALPIVVWILLARKKVEEACAETSPSRG